MEERLNKYIASTGVASRRKADELILNGDIAVNGEKITTLGTKVDTDNDVVTLKGNIIEANTNMVYLMFHKPKGCITTLSDEKNRKTVFEYIDLDIPHLFPVGRLDYNTEGLLLITNDGELANKLMHPASEIYKTYYVTIKGHIEHEDIKKLRYGVTLDDGKVTSRAGVAIIKKDKDTTKLEVRIHEGYNRQIRRMFKAVDKEIILLKRVAIGDLRLGGVTRGTYRFLNKDEVNYLKCL